MTEGKGDDITVAVVVSEVNMVDKKKDWMIDSSVSRHICSNRTIL